MGAVMIPRLMTPAIALLSFGAALGLATLHASTAPAPTVPPPLTANVPALVPGPAPAQVLAAANDASQDIAPAEPMLQTPAAPLEKFPDAPDRADPGHGARSH